MGKVGREGLGLAVVKDTSSSCTPGYRPSAADFPPMGGFDSSAPYNEYLAGGLVSTVFIGYLLFFGRYIVARFPAWFTHLHKWFKYLWHGECARNQTHCLSLMQ